MIIESPRYTERFGSVRINDVQKVLALDSGREKELSVYENIAVQRVKEDTIKDLEERMAVVIPVKDEKLKLFEGVISGIPHECLIIVISNSQRSRIDRFRMEQDALNQFCHFTRREALIFHQKDPLLARSLADAGYKSILGADGLIRNGKAEGMIAAMFIAMLSNKDYVGFIDADNYFPGAVWEYVKCFATSFSMARSPYAMARVLWRYKPKVSSGMYFKKWGRVSETTNKCMNSLISNRTGFETEIIKTGNAGEHAMSMKLAELITYASSYAVEPQELISIFEGFGGILPMSYPAAAKHGIEIFQTETRNPHLHEEKGGQHITKEMLLPGLGTIYHSPICEDETKKVIINELLQQNAIESGGQPPVPIFIDPLNKLNLKKFTNAMADKLESYSALEKHE
ncbi:MAG: mannosyl-3-phosphoglycerate synthase [Dehalococcoidia bacterium]|nr:mannosyl-3-phosphoglycerate synthase [Dehalococcoidia bacterium]